MRLIDADELRKNVLKWMPSDPCGKEEKEFPFETDICASMVMEIDDAPTVQPYTTTRDSIPAKTGKNDGDRNSGDCISRQAVIDLWDKYHHTIAVNAMEYDAELRQLPSAQPEIIRCKDCKYYKYGICMKIGANKSFYGFCDWAERGEQNG